MSPSRTTSAGTTSTCPTRRRPIQVPSVEARSVRTNPSSVRRIRAYGRHRRARAARGPAVIPRAGRGPSRRARASSPSPSRPGWRPKPQYIATPKSPRYFEAVRVAAAQPGQAVDRQHDARGTPGCRRRRRSAQRREEALVLAAQVARAGQVQPVDRPPGLGHGVVGHADDAAPCRGPRTSATRGTCRSRGGSRPGPPRGPAASAARPGRRSAPRRPRRSTPARPRCRATS